MATSITTPRKRARGSPTGKTPLQLEKRASNSRCSGKRKLTYYSVSNRSSKLSVSTSLYTPVTPWTSDEDQSLIKFILLYSGDNEWPATKLTTYWEGASRFVLDNNGGKRTSGACRTRVARVLKKKFTTPLLAEKFYKSNHQDESLSSETQCTPRQATVSENRSTCSPINSDDGHRETSQSSSVSSSTSIVIRSIDTLEVVSEKLNLIESDEQLKFLDELFAKCCSSRNLRLPPSFLSYCVKGMLRLQESSRSNFLYGLAKGLGTLRSSGADSVFPTKQIIAGMVEYSINFFNATTVAQVSCPPDYRMWLQTMYSLFGNKWLNIHGGPMWKVETTEQGMPVSLSTSRKTEEARVNIPSLSARTIQRDIASSHFSIGANIQLGILDEAVLVLPDAEWWIKSDGCDVVCGLTESTRCEWSGDVDLGDGSVQKQHADYLARIERVNGLSLAKQNLVDELCTVQQSLKEDLCYLPGAVKKADDEYKEKLSSDKATSDKVMYELCWTVDELVRLLEEGRHLYVEVTSLVEIMSGDHADLIQRNVARRLSDLQSRLIIFIRTSTSGCNTHTCHAHQSIATQ